MFANCTYYYNVNHPILTGVIERESISRQRLSVFSLPAVRMSKNNTKKPLFRFISKRREEKEDFCTQVKGRQKQYSNHVIMNWSRGRSKFSSFFCLSCYDVLLPFLISIFWLNISGRCFLLPTKNMLENKHIFIKTLFYSV
jgi:hypothetical protein